MCRALPWLVGCLLLCPVSHIAAAPERSDENPYAVTGVVFDKQTRAPVVGAAVKFLFDEEQDAERRSRTAVTDEQGRYRLAAPLGSFRCGIRG